MIINSSNFFLTVHLAISGYSEIKLIQILKRELGDFDFYLQHQKKKSPHNQNIAIRQKQQQFGMGDKPVYIFKHLYCFLILVLLAATLWRADTEQMSLLLRFYVSRHKQVWIVKRVGGRTTTFLFQGRLTKCLDTRTYDSWSSILKFRQK